MLNFIFKWTDNTLFIIKVIILIYAVKLYISFIIFYI